MDITNLLKENGFLEKLASQYGLDSTQVEEVVSKGLPEITKSINANTSTENGLSSFMKALQDHKDDPVDEMLADPNKVDTTDGSNILSHILGDRKENLTNELSQVQGLSASSITGIFSSLAPILMGMLGKQATGGSSAGGGLLDSLLGSDSPVSKMGKSFLDKDKDGSFLDDLLGGIFKK